LKIFATGAKWLFMLSLPVLLLTASIGWAANSLWLYQHGFEENGARQATGLADSELEKVATGLIGYFNSAEKDISLTVVKDGKQVNLFTPEEVIHFRDVKGLIRLNYGVLLGTLLYSLVYTGACLWGWKDRRRLARGTIGGSAIALALVLALGLGTLLDFDRLFLRFHLLAFTNEFWSAGGYMLLLFRDPFFYDATLLCAAIVAGAAIILGGAGGVYLKKQGYKPPEQCYNCRKNE